MVEKVNTHVLLEKALRDMAKARNVSISRTCNDALAARLSLPDTKEELVVQKHKLKEELKAIEAKEEELNKNEAVRSRKQVLEEMQADVKELHAFWVKHLNGQVKDSHWAALVSKFCEVWKVDRAIALAYAEGRKEVL